MVLNWITQNCCVYAHAQCVGVHISDWITHIDSYQQGSGVEKVIVAIHTSLFQFGIQIHRPLLECGASSSDLYLQWTVHTVSHSTSVVNCSPY